MFVQNNAFSWLVGFLSSFFFFFVSLKGRDISQSCTEVMKGTVSCNQYVFSDGGITNLNLHEFLFLERLWLMYVASDVWSFFDWCMWLIFTHTEGTLGKIHPNKRDTERYCFLLDGLLICCKQVIFYHYIFYRVFFSLIWICWLAFLLTK